jgi:hypothetical protein
MYNEDISKYMLQNKRRKNMNDYDSSYYIMRIVFGIVWLVAGIIMGNKAKEQGMQFWLYFLITWWGGLIGLVISIALIDKQKKKNAMYQNQFQQNPYQQNPYQQNPYQQNQYQQNPYQQNPYGQNYNQQNWQPQGGQNSYGANSYGSPSGTGFQECPNCGNSQKSGSFCEICGTKLN